MKTLFIVFLFFSVVPASAQISNKLMSWSMVGHHANTVHEFVISLKDPKSFRREQIAQFLQDRIYVLKIMEEKASLNPDSDQVKKLFFRSEAYQQDLYNLIGKRTTV